MLYHSWRIGTTRPAELRLGCLWRGKKGCTAQQSCPQSAPARPGDRFLRKVSAVGTITRSAAATIGVGVAGRGSR